MSCFYTGKLENGVVFDSNISGAGSIYFYPVVYSTQIFHCIILFMTDLRDTFEGMIGKNMSLRNILNDMQSSGLCLKQSGICWHFFFLVF